MPKSILFVVEPGKFWMGGVYYVRNILKTLSYANWMQVNHIHVLCPPEHEAIFAPLSANFRHFSLHPRVSKNNLGVRIINKVIGPSLGRIDIEVIQACEHFEIDSIFPVPTYHYALLRAQQIHWIPDFQHKKLPEFFTSSDRSHRNREFSHIVMAKRPLILSSITSLEDLKEFAPDHRCTPIVLPFVADIDDDIRNMRSDQDREYLANLGVPFPEGDQKYLYIPNQFWRHKNHMVVVLAMAEILRLGGNVPTVICTGSTKDYRSKSYFSDLMSVVLANHLESHFKVLSMIGRQEQLSILKNCHALLQPSLFEGWGTGVQEAKRFGCKLLLSNIRIHQEQRDSETVFFEPGDPVDLAKAMTKILELPRQIGEENNLQQTNADSARKYAEGAAVLFGGSVDD